MTRKKRTTPDRPDQPLRRMDGLRSALRREPRHPGQYSPGQQEQRMGCHAAATQLVGPAYRSIAAKYADQSGALQAVTENIRKGGSGKWGDIPMPPQSQLPEADARWLAAWILGGAK